MSTVTSTEGTATRRPGRRRNPPPALVTAVSLGVVLVVWQLAILLFDIPARILPAPTRIATEADWCLVAEATGDTLLATVIGFVVGNVLGLVLAIVIFSSRTLADIVYPLAVVVRSIPIVALAPFITLVAGRGPSATIIVAALIVFFPTLVNTILGLRSAPREAIELMRIVNAGPVFGYLRVRVPYALPAFVSALRISAPNAVLGVMTAEWIIGGQGLGRLIIRSWLNLEIPTMWGAVIASAAIAWLLFNLLGVVERAVLGWAVRT